MLFLSSAGVYKIEADGQDTCIALSAKCYILSSDKGVRIRAKGVPVQKLLDNPLEAFFRVLKAKTTRTASVKGFMSNQGQVFTYEVSEKNALSYAYVKRLVMDDGFSTCTIPFKITNFPQTFECIVSEYELLSPTCTHDAAYFTFDNRVQPSIMHALIQAKNDQSPASENSQEESPNLRDERAIFMYYHSIVCTEEWERAEFAILERIIRCRMDQIPFLYGLLMKKQSSLPFLYATEFSQILGCGANRHLARYHPPASKAGHNMVGKIYDKIKQEKLAQATRKRKLQSPLQ